MLPPLQLGVRGWDEGEGFSRPCDFIRNYCSLSVYGWANHSLGWWIMWEGRAELGGGIPEPISLGQASQLVLAFCTIVF